jgi:membrane-bound lytic murein transglycosylase D
MFLFSACASLREQNLVEKDWGQQEDEVKRSKAPPCPNCLPGLRATVEADLDSYYAFGTEHLEITNRTFGIPVTYNKSVQKWVKYFTGRGRKSLERYIENAQKYAPLIAEILDDHQMPRDLVFLLLGESGFQIHAKSRAKAIGFWQFMKFTGKRFGLTIDWYLDERKDPFKATKAAIDYLSYLKNRFGAWELAWASYNAGESKVSRAIKRYKSNSFWKIRRGRYLRRETKNYVPKIMALALIGKNLSHFGFEQTVKIEPLDFEIIKVNPLSDLFLLAESLEMEYGELRNLNPELRRWQTPPGIPFGLKVPTGKKEFWNNCCASDLASYQSDKYQEVKFSTARSLKAIAKTYRVPAKIVADINELKENSFVRAKTKIKLPFRDGQSRRHYMYADLYERRYRRKRMSMNKYIRLAKLYGKEVSNPSVFYTVKKGDTLWDVAKKNGVSLNTLIKSNLSKVKSGSIYPGDKLVIK